MIFHQFSGIKPTNPIVPAIENINVFFEMVMLYYLFAYENITSILYFKTKISV